MKERVSVQEALFLIISVLPSNDQTFRLAWRCNFPRPADGPLNISIIASSSANEFSQKSCDKLIEADTFGFG